MRFLLRPSLAASLVLATALMAGCGDGGGRPPAATIRIVSIDIDETVVSAIRMTMRPQGNSSFTEDPTLVGSDFIEGLSSRFDGDSPRNFIIEASGGYVAENFFVPSGGTAANFAVDIPVFTSEDQEFFAGMNPQLFVEVFRDTESIGDSDVGDLQTGFLPVPIDPDQPPLVVQVACKTIPDPMTGDPVPLPQCSPDT